MSEATVIGRVAVKVVPDTSRFRSELKKEMTKATAGLVAKIKVEFDNDQLRAEARRVKDRLEDELDNVKAGVKANVDETSSRKAQVRLALLARDRYVELKVRLQEKSVAQVGAALAALSGARSVATIFEDLWDGVKNLDKAVPKIAALSLGILNLGGYLLTATSNSLAFGASLASIGQAGLALPGILGGIAIGVGATIAVFKDFNKVLPNVAKEFHELQDSMSERFWRKAKAPIADFIESMFPDFRRGMNRVSTELGGFFANLATSSKGILIPALDGMFKDLGASIKIAGSHTDAFVKIIRTLGTLGAGQLPRLAGWFGDISDKFGNWLTKNEKSGQLLKWVDEGIKSLQDFGNVLRYTGSTLATLAQIAEEAGGSSLAMMADTMKSVSETVKKADFRKNLGDVFESAHKAMSNISSSSGKQFQGFMERLAHTLTAVLPKAGSALGEALGAIFDALDNPRVQKTVIGFFDNIGKAVHDLAPAMPAVAQGLSALVDVAGTLAVVIAKVAAKIFKGLGPGLDSVADGLIPLIQRLGSLVEAVALSRVLKDLGKVLGFVAKALANLLKPVELLADLFGKLPGPVKSATSMLIAVGAVVGAATWMGFAVRAKIAGIGASFAELALGAKVAAVGVEQAGTAAAVASARTVAAKAAMRNLAGTGGLLAVADSANRSNKAMGALQGAMGGALVGSVIPGVGTAVGALAGAGVGGLLGLALSGHKASDSMKDIGKVASSQIPPLTGLRDTLDQVTGAFTAMSKQMVAQELRDKGAFELAGQFGISTRDVVNAALGQEAAMKRVKVALADAQKGYQTITTYGLDPFGHVVAQQKVVTTEAANQANKLASTLGFVSSEANKQVAEVRELALSTANLKALYPGFPKEVITQIRQVGGAETAAKIAEIGSLVKLTKPQIKVLLSTAGLPATKADIAAVQAAIKATDGKTAKVKTEVDSKALPNVLGLANKIAGVFGKQTATAKANLKPFKQSFNQQAAGIAGNATTQGQQIGSNLTQGFVSGINADIAAAAAARMAQAASNAARANLDIHSPSRVFKKIGRFLTLGFVQGIAGGTDKVVTQMDALIGLLKKTHNKGLVKLGKDTKAHLEALGKQWDAYAARIEEIGSYVSGIADNIARSGSPTEVNGGSFADITANLQGATRDAQAFADVLGQLRNMKLNKTTMDQLAAAGPEAALAAAQAIAQAGQAGVDQINVLQGQLSTAAQATGNAAADVMFANGQNIVAGLLAGIQSQQSAIESTMEAIATTMVKVIKKKLKIKSPSRVFKQLGGYVGDGFVLGVESRHASASSAIAKLGSGRPAVPAYSSFAPGGTSVQSTSKTINYYAAPGSSINEEEDLFAALRRARSA